MKKIILSALLTLLISAFTYAQDYTTPNTGVTWTLDDIAAASPTTITISGNQYTLWGNLTVAENDALIIDSNITLFVEAAKLITVFGAFTVDVPAASITALNANAPYGGFRFEEFSEIDIKNTFITYSGGLRVLTETFSIDNCTLGQNVPGATTSAVIQLSRGMPQITNNTISFNDLPAIGSAANSAVSAYIFNNLIQSNNRENGNRPQINMGTTMANEPLQIVGNMIIGDSQLTMTGGIAIANFVGGDINVEIMNNTIRGNRYGISILGPVNSAQIINNIIEDNNIQGNPNLGGSGINLNTSTAGATVIASANEIRRNLWGITLEGLASIDLGNDINNPGVNFFNENGNNGVLYALYNNTPNPISAKSNCWIEDLTDPTLEDVEDVIFHFVDDPTLGEVTFDPINCAILEVPENIVENFSFYPNPTNGEINFNNQFGFSEMKIFGVAGNLLKSQAISEGTNTLEINLPSGMYFVNFANNVQSVTKKMIVE